MKKEDKELLFQDLCGRLPYGVKCEVYDRIGILDEISSYGAAVNYSNGEDTTCRIECVKPYLFPLSSMTEEQKIECFKGTDIELDEYNEIWSTFPISNSDIALTNLNNWLKVINWLNKNHFDYRGLIEKGLAIDCTNLNIY